LRSELIGTDVSTVAEMGWSGKTNGELIQLMRTAGFDVLVTVDQGFPHQQNISASSIALVVLHGASNKFKDLLPLVPSLRQSSASIRSGDVLRIST
jgi:hypothetical protein